LSRSDPTTNQNDLLGWAARGTIVTRTRRLAREILSEIGEANALSGKKVFETPDVLPVEAWFQRLWRSLDPGAEILRDSAELHLWRETIASDLDARHQEEPVTANQVAKLADSAAAAWKSIRRWQEPRWSDIPLTPDVEAFRRWANAFGDRLASQWVTAAELPDRLANEARTTRAYVADHVVFVGFERIEPALRRLIDALSDCGVAITEPNTATIKPADPLCASAPNVDAEVRRLASQVHADIMRDPSTSIGILAADLSSYRSLLERHLGTELDPASLVPGACGRLPPLRRVFDLAGAPALSDYGIVAHALDLLRLAYRGNSFELVSRILLAPYPRRAEDDEREREAELRAQVELKLRRDNRLAIGIDRLAETAAAVGAKEFAACARALAKLLPKTPRRARPSAWARYFVSRLVCFGWPGVALDHDGDEGVAYGRWRDIIDELAALDAVCDAMTAAEAQTELRRLCGSVAVQAPSGGLGVQAMGLLDAAGLHFDKLYVVGMTADVFPAPTRPHPLLPAEWQRAAGLPLASPEVEATFAASVWQRVRTSCRELMVSWPENGARGEANVPSPVVGHGVAREPSIAPDDELAMPWYARAGALAAIEFDEDDTGAVPAALVRRGGTSLLKDHSACPFRSFASRRLRVEAFDEPEPEPKASTRGELVHRVLELVWAELATSAALRALDDSQLQERVESAAYAAVTRSFAGSDEGGRSEPAQQAEQAERAEHAVPSELAEHASLIAWLVAQVSGWLRFERDGERQDWRVDAVEERTDVPLGEYADEPAILLERLSVDRIDVLDDDAALVIDYKTSSSSMGISEWANDRPREPQLPIYAVALSNAGRTVAGVAFANLAARDDLGFRGVSDEVIVPASIGPPRKSGGVEWPGMQSQIAAWATTLTELAEDYAAGNAKVAPRSLTKDCTWCRRQPLCRVFESVDVEDDDDGV
jgi:ATP-dependent helicase/nuclease subunit B